MVNCDLCLRSEIVTTGHHLIPRTMHSKKRIRRDYTRIEMNKRVPFCKECHKQIHKLFTERELAYTYNTLEILKAQSSVQKWIAFVKDKPNGKRFA